MKKNEQLENVLEALMFAHGDPVSIQKLARVIGVQKREVQKALSSLQKRLEEESGIRCIIHQDAAQLVTAPSHTAYVEKLFKSEHREDLSRAALEVLAIVAYRGPVSRNEIETIRGVNSSYILRNLSMRGLVDKHTEKKEVRYALSTDMLRTFGVTEPEELPDWNAVQKELDTVYETLTEAA